jgi:DNA invertase Pin-like site-specific DNA recombinase
MKVAIYCRVSTDEQNIANQEKLCREYCARAGFDVYHVYSDEGVSGMKTSRPSFDRLLADMRLYRFDCIMVTKLDRVGRSLQHILSLFEEWKNKGVHFIATTQNIDTSSPAGKLQMQMLGAFAEFERNIISERTKEGIRDNPKVGKRGKDKHPRQKRGVLRKPWTLVEKEGGESLEVKTPLISESEKVLA